MRRLLSMRRSSVFIAEYSMLQFSPRGGFFIEPWPVLIWPQFFSRIPMVGRSIARPNSSPCRAPRRQRCPLCYRLAKSDYNLTYLYLSISICLSVYFWIHLSDHLTTYHCQSRCKYMYYQSIESDKYPKVTLINLLELSKIFQIIYLLSLYSQLSQYNSIQRFIYLLLQKWI